MTAVHQSAVVEAFVSAANVVSTLGPIVMDLLDDGELTGDQEEAVREHVERNSNVIQS